MQLPGANRRSAVSGLAVLLAGAGVLAGEGEPRLRVAVLFGGAVPTAEVLSSSANVLTLVDESGAVVDRYNDPRDDATLERPLQVHESSRIGLSIQYFLSPQLLLEAQVGREATDVGDIEVQEVLTFRRIVGVPAGRLERIPLSVGGTFRFRPEANFHPYVGLALGHSWLDFETSDELDQLSANMAGSRGKPTQLLTENWFDRINVLNIPLRPVEGATHTARSDFEWRLGGGAELALGGGWFAVLDLAYTYTDAALTIGFDGAEDLGAGVPQATAVLGTELATARYGPFQILEGGVADLTGDGSPDPGYYFVDGGRLRLDGFQFQFGIRYTF